MAASACLIVSALQVVARPLCYSPVRSVFTAEERLEQTIASIRSVREHLPEADVVVAEHGIDPGLAAEITDEVDRLVYLGSKRRVRRATDSPWKGAGEATAILGALDVLAEYDRYFKLTGRYCLTDRFEAAEWQRDGFTFRDFGSAGVSTTFYAVAGGQAGVWRHALRRALPEMRAGHGIEVALRRHIPGSLVHTTGTIGVVGLCAPNGAPVEL